MSTLKTTNIAHPSSASNNIVLDASGNVNIDSNTLYVDATNNRVGIGTASPSFLLTASASSTSTTLNDSTHWTAAVLNTGAATANQYNSLLLKFADGTYNGNSVISALRESGTGRQQSLIFAPSNSTGDPTERMRISQAGDVNIGKTAYTSIGTNGHTLEAGGLAHHSVSSNAPLNLNRNVDDGNLVTLFQAGTIEGTISVSGTTVSYNGAHLSRWSQLPSGVERTEILRGSVLSNLDEMCEWGEEDNEQLNRMKVSDVEGDKNVSGVFQCWDDDDDTYINDFYCAMTGDFIIRIAAGVTIERGDLLMSAGDGTAKPQGDGYVQDKTIAKVTSTNVSCTYDDGSYCVPCVLMAC